ncbi:MAG: MmgE/PrpD family protein [Alcaligenaceae bacterium]|nr:MmgE/PrpD family protein [Alcaligenaceae bacterium]
MTTSKITQQLTAFLTSLDYEGIPSPTRNRCIDLLIDHLAVSVAGMSLPWTQALRQYALDQQTGGRCVIYGAQRTTADLAALVNGTMAHGIELDDTHEASVSHPGAVIFAAVLAVAQERESSAKETITAIVAGYEAMGRIGAAFDPDFMARGSHPTANHGVFGACTGAAKLLGLSSTELNMAWGIASSLNSGSMAFTEDPMGTMVKRLHAGWPAHSGVVAAKLAKLGFTGPRDTLDRQKGYIGRNSPAARREVILDGLGQNWVVDDISIKPYACCRLFHSAIDAITRLKKEEAFRLGDIASVKAYGSKHMIDGHMEYRPESVMSAQYSLPFSLAVALCGNAGDPRQFGVDRLGSPTTLALADLISGIVSEELAALFPQKYAGSIEIRLRDGRTLKRTVLDCSGSPANALDRAAIRKKFELLTEAHINPVQRNAILECVESLPEQPNLNELSTLLIGSDHADQQ